MSRSVNTPLLLLVSNYFSAVYLLMGVAFGFTLNVAGIILLFYVLFWVYLLPPLLCRLLITAFGRPEGKVGAESPVFQYWWFLTQLQILYTRFPFLEELLRVFPGVYSLWLNLWGGRVSLLCYWAPGVTVADRYHLHIGKGAVIGGGCRIGAHVLWLNEKGERSLIVAPVRIDGQSLVGIHAAVGPGCHVHANETVPAGKLLKPFYTLKDGKARRPERYNEYFSS